MTADIIPHQNGLFSKVMLEIAKGGGHVGFVTEWNPFNPIMGWNKAF
jgi:predicted alpha/beta-fold hydrolase